MSGIVSNTATLIANAIDRVYQNTMGLISGTNLQQQLLDMNVSQINRLTDSYLLNLRTYDATNRTVDNPYRVGECCVRGGIVYQCTTLTYGTWNASNWVSLSVSQSTRPQLTMAQMDLLTASDMTISYDVLSLDEGGVPRTWSPQQKMWL
jgi:hypothetical protein